MRGGEEEGGASPGGAGRDRTLACVPRKDSGWRDPAFSRRLSDLDLPLNRRQTSRETPTDLATAGGR